MAKPLLAEDLWERIEPLLPTDRPKPKGGRPPVSNRQRSSASCLCCAPVVLASIFPKNWAAARA